MNMPNKYLSCKKACIFLFLHLIFISLSCEKKEISPILGIDPIPNVARYEDHSEALAHWAEEGVRDAVIINIDTHDDIRRISKERISELEDIYLRRDMKTLREANSLADRSLYNVGDFIFAAARLGIVKEAYWIIPFAHFAYPDTANRLRIFLETYGFSSEDINTFNMEGGCFRGLTDGIPLSLCGVEALPEIEEPVILSFDLDTLPTAAFEYKRDKTTAMQMIFDALFAKRYMVRDALVAYSVNGGYMRVLDKWLGDEAAKVMESPGYRGSLLWTALQKADIAYKQKRLGKSMDQLMPFLGRFADEPAVQIYIAFAEMELGRIDDAFKYAEKACLTDRTYCYGLVELGYEIHQSAQSDGWEKFYRRGYGLNPGMNHRLVNMALHLRDDKRYDEALEFLFRHRKMNSLYPVDFLIGETMLLKGDEEGAGKYFDSVRIYLRRSLYTTVKNAEDVIAIKSAFDYYIKKGDMESALELKSNPSLGPAFIEAGE